MKKSPLIIVLLFLTSSCFAQTITQQPTNQTVPAGQTATFTVGFSGGPCQQVWYTTSIGNHYGQGDSASPASLSIPNVTLAMNNTTVEVILYGCAGGNAVPLSSVATLTVTPSVPLASITITPSTPTVAVGSTQKLTAVGTYTDGSTQSLTSASWTSDTPNIATVSSSGVVSAVATGTANISVLSGGFTASTNVTVNLATAVLVINPSVAVFDDGTPVLPGSIVISQLQNPTTTPITVPVGTIVSDSTGHLSGSLQINPNPQFLDANGNVDLVFGLPLFPNLFTYPVPAAEFQQGATGLTLNLVLYKKALVVKSQTIAMTP
jgi:hypothetical protein